MKTKRKSPIRHRVSNHVKLGKPIASYMRGKGQRKPVAQRKLKLYPTGDISVQAHLEKEGGFADVSIVPYVNQINRMGFETTASCSGMARDHHGVKQTAYLSVVLPESVAKPDLGGDIFEVDPRNVKDKAYINKLIKAGHDANWNAELGKYMMFLPTVSFTMPKTKSWVVDNVVKMSPKLVKAQEELDVVFRRPHTSREFLDALHKRDKIRDETYKRYRARVRSDAEVDKAWRRLVKELSKVEAKK